MKSPLKSKHDILLDVISARSEHPLGAAIVKYARRALGAPQLAGSVSGFQAVPGCGLKASP